MDRSESERESLRRRAEAALRDQIDGPRLSSEDARKLIHELRTHQIELELQNEELQVARRELEAARDRYSDLYEFAPVGYLTVSDTGRIERANLTAAGILGVDREELVQSHLSSFVQVDDRDSLHLNQRQLLQTGEPKAFELRMQSRSSDPVWARFEAARVASGDGIAHIRMVLSDVTQQKLADEKRHEFEANLEQTQRLESLGLLAGGISHDFNNLLTVIQANADIALRQLGPDSPASSPIREICTAASRAADLTRQLLAYAGRGVVSKRRIRLDHFVGQLLDFLRTSLLKTVRLDVDLRSGARSILADPVQLHQIILNLCINGSEAIGQRDGVVRITTSVVSRDRDRAIPDHDREFRSGTHFVALEVEDTGCGIAEEARARIFDPFFTTKSQGRGLGLAAVHGILRSHGGSIELRSATGKGSVFTVLFPAVEDDETEIDVEPRPHAAPRVMGASILIVDDDPSILRAVKTMLERAEFRVRAASNGEEAINQLSGDRHGIDVVLLDLSMPGLGGEETFGQLRKIRPDLSVVLMSGYAEADVLQRFQGAGLSGFIQKPFRAQDLIAKLSDALEASRGKPKRLNER